MDGDALWRVVEEQALEGVVAKPLGSLYKPGERGWLKVKNKTYWKYALEREATAERRGTVLSPAGSRALTV